MSPGDVVKKLTGKEAYLNQDEWDYCMHGATYQWKDFEKMGYTVERDFNLDKFKGIQDLRKEYQEQFKQAAKEMKQAGKNTPSKDEFIASMGDLKGNIPLLYKNVGKEGVQDAINTLKQEKNTYEELLDVVGVMKGLENGEDNPESIGRHTIPFD